MGTNSKEYMRAWREKNREKTRQYVREWVSARKAIDPEYGNRPEDRARRKELAATRDPERRRKIQRAAYRRNRAKRLAAAKQLYARIGHTEAYRAQNLARAAKWYAENSEYQKAKAKEWNANNPDRKRAHSRKGQAKRRAALKIAVKERIDYDAIIKRDGMRCHVCGLNVTKDTLSFDHLIPVSKGGPHTMANIAVAHRVCNSARGPGRIPVAMRK